MTWVRRIEAENPFPEQWRLNGPAWDAFHDFVPKGQNQRLGEVTETLVPNDPINHPEDYAILACMREICEAMTRHAMGSDAGFAHLRSQSGPFMLLVDMLDRKGLRIGSPSNLYGLSDAIEAAVKPVIEEHQKAIASAPLQPNP